MADTTTIMPTPLGSGHEPALRHHSLLASSHSNLVYQSSEKLGVTAHRRRSSAAPPTGTTLATKYDVEPQDDSGVSVLSLDISEQDSSSLESVTVADESPKAIVADPIAQVAEGKTHPEVAAVAEEQPKVGVLQRGWDYFVASWFDFRWALSILDPREFIFPLTWRKAAYWSGYLTFVGTIVLTEYYFSWLQYINPYSWTVLALTIFLVTFEPFMLSLLCIFNRPLEADKTAEEMGLTQEEVYEMNQEISILICCHLSEDVILPTLRCAVRHVREEQIYIVHNGNSALPIDRTEEVARAAYPKINYVWSNIGNKTVAQFVGLKMAKQYPYTVVLDDDVLLQENFTFPKHLIQGKTKGVAFPIAAVPGEDKKPNWLTRSQDIEYKIAGSVKQFQGATGSVIAPHGAIAMWDREAFEEILYKTHDTIFYAEDMKCGTGAAQLGYHLAYHGGSYIATEVPRTVMGGTHPNFYTQRIRSWEMAGHAYTGMYIKMFVTCWYVGPTIWKTISGNMVRKMYESYLLFCLMMDVLSVPLIVLAAFVAGWQVWVVLAGAVLLNLCVMMVWKYRTMKRRNDSPISYTSIIVYSLVYKMMMLPMRFFGSMRCYLIYLPNLKRKPLIPDYERDELRGRFDPIWLRAGYQDGTYDDDKFRQELQSKVAQSETAVQMS